MLLLAGVLLGAALGVGAGALLWNRGSTPEDQGPELLALYAYEETLQLDVPVPALRFQVVFRVQEAPQEAPRMELLFQNALKDAWGEGTESVKLETKEEHFGWTVYTYGCTLAGDGFTHAMQSSVMAEPEKYVTVRFME